MNTAARTAAMALTLLVSVGAASETLAEGWRPSDHPEPRIASAVPSLGFAYRVIPGYGFGVIVVRPGTPAAQIRLEIGDVVLSVNGHPLTHIGADLPARLEAARHGGWITLGIREVRTGRAIIRSTNLFYPYGGSGQQIISIGPAR